MKAELTRGPELGSLHSKQKEYATGQICAKNYRVSTERVNSRMASQVSPLYRIHEGRFTRRT